jgi:hypothetical protein
MMFITKCKLNQHSYKNKHVCIKTVLQHIQEKRLKKKTKTFIGFFWKRYRSRHFFFYFKEQIFSLKNNATSSNIINKIKI